jgi:ribosomal protein S12 methylthiotransferase
MKKVGFVSLGCPKNLVDSEVMMGVLQQHGLEITAQAADADVIVVNTCSFIGDARQESVDAILDMAEYKKSGRAQRLVVAGCMVERYGDEIRREIPEVDALIGTNELTRIAAACRGDDSDAPHVAAADPRDAVRAGGRRDGVHDGARGMAAATNAMTPLNVLPATFFDPTLSAPYLYDDLTPRLLATPRYSAYVKIAEGCDHPCTFCVIPQFRGSFRSRRFESVVAEARRLAANGVRELTLIGQDTTSYGEDLKIKDGLALLLERLAAIEPLTWIRALYFYPNRVTQRLLDTIAAHPRLCKYVDMPLQHASPAVLKRMKRGGGAEHFLKLIERIRATIPGVAVRTSVIVGFPGETEDDFKELCDFVREARFDWMGVFAYSDEETGKAFHLDGKVPQRTIEARRRRLMAIQKSISHARRAALVGTRLPVLIEGASDETDLLWQGRLESQAPEIDGKVLINEFPADVPLPAGTFATVEITEAHDYDLVGRVVGPAAVVAGERTAMPAAPIVAEAFVGVPAASPALER